MKKLPNLLIFLTICCLTTQAQLIDISNNKGMILPIVPNANKVANPLEGQILYNQNSKSLNYNNGSNWQNLYSTSLPSDSDSITYTIPTNGNWQVGPFQLTDLVQQASNNINLAAGGGQAWTVSVGNLTFTKPFDSNSWVFKRNVYSGAVTPRIEIKFFKHQTAIPYYSIRLDSWVVSQYYFNIGASGVVEQISLNFAKISFKDWAIPNNGFAYDITTRTLTNGPYN